MKIALFIGDMGRGGAERVASLIVNNLVKNGNSIDIVCLFGIQEVGYELDNRVRLVDLSGTDGKYYSNVFSWVRGIRKYVRKSKPDFIISFFGRINSLVLLACIGLKTPIVVSERNDILHDNRKWIEALGCKIVYSLATKVILQTEYQKNCFPKRLHRKCVVIPNPVSVSTERSVIKEFKVVNVARTSKQKNQEILLQAIYELKTKYPSVFLEIYGNRGNNHAALEKAIHEMNLENRVFFKGSVSNIHDCIADSSVFVLSSNYEGMPNALAEAMLIGIPCVSTDCSGINELIVNNQNGLLIKVGSVSELVAAIAFYFDHRKLAEEYGERAKLTIKEKCNPDSVVKKWIDLMNNLVGSNE